MATVNHNLIYEALTDVQRLISYQNANFPSDEEWDSWLSAASSLHHQKKVFRLLVVTAGGHPTKSQLERLRATNREVNPPTAIISTSRAFRFMAAALTFINPTIRCFSPAHSDKAFAHLTLTERDRGCARDVIERLNRRLSGNPSS